MADAVNSAQQAATSEGSYQKVIATATAGNDLPGVVAGGMQKTLQQFSPNSIQATRLLGNLGNSTSVLGLSLAALPIYAALKDGKSITTSQLDALSGAALLTGAVLLPEVAVMLTVVGSLMVAASIFDTNDQNTPPNAVARLKDLIQPYYGQLAPSDQAAFTSAMSGTMQSTLSGGMLLPVVNEAGWISGYRAENAANVAAQGDGGTLYTFASGVTYIVGTVSDDGPLTGPSENGRKSVWTIPETGPDIATHQTDANKPLTLNIYQDGCYTSHFTDSEGNLVTVVFIVGSSGMYTVAPMSNPSGGGEYQFVCVVGTDNQVNVLGDNNMVSIAAGNRANIEGGGNTIHASGDTTVTLGPASGNIVWNEITRETLSTSEDVITIAGNPYGVLGGATIQVGITNSITTKADGSQELVLKYDDSEDTFRFTYNAAHVMTAYVITSPDGSRSDTLYDPVTGRVEQVTITNASGSGSTYKCNSTGQTIEVFTFKADGSGTRYFEDPLTQKCIGMNEVDADGSETPVFRAPVPSP